MTRDDLRQAIRDALDWFAGRANRKDSETVIRQLVAADESLDSPFTEEDREFMRAMGRAFEKEGQSK